MAAKQRLIRGRKRSRAYKLGLIAELFGMRLPQSCQQEISMNSLPSSPNLGIRTERIRGGGSTPGSIQKFLSSTTSNESEIIPPDPNVNTTINNSTKQGSIHHV